MSSVEKTWEPFRLGLKSIGELDPDRSILEKAIPQLFRIHVPNLVLYDDYLQSQEDLVHYTNWESAQKMFSKEQNPPALRLYNLEHSNDPEEGKTKPQEWYKIEKNAKWITNLLGSNPDRENPEFEGSAYCCSFSSGPPSIKDDLMYWRMYGNNGEGCSLKIIKREGNDHNEEQSQDLERSIAQKKFMPTYSGFRMYKVRYRNRTDSGKAKKGSPRRTQTEIKEDQEVASRLKDIFSLSEKIVHNLGDNKIHLKQIIAKGLNQILYGYYHLVKDGAYAAESEWRMIVVMPNPSVVQFDTQSKNIVKRYIEGPPLEDLLMSNSTITIGPTVPNRGAARAYIERLVRTEHEMAGVKVMNSNVSFRKV